MNIGYAYCSHAARAENLAVLNDADCERVLVEAAPNERKQLEAIIAVLRQDDVLVVRAPRQVADDFRQLALVADAVRRAGADLKILSGDYTAEDVFRASNLLRDFAVNAAMSEHAAGTSEDNSGKRPYKRAPVTEIEKRLRAGVSCPVIARELGLPASTVHRVRRRLAMAEGIAQ